MKDKLYLNNYIANKEPAYLTYTAIRSLDDAGSGVIRSNIHIIAALLKRSPVTIKRHLKSAYQKGWYHYLDIQPGGDFKCSYKSSQKLHRAYPKENTLTGKVPVREFYTNPKLAAVWSEACLRTKRHQRKLERLPNRKASDPMFGKRLVIYEGVQNCTGLILNRQTLTITHPYIIHAGASQQTIADGLGVTRRTVNRLLKRVAPTLNTVPYLKVSQWVPYESLDFEVIDELYYNSRYGRYTRSSNGMIWENKTCIYPTEPWQSKSIFTPRITPQQLRASILRAISERRSNPNP